MEHLQTRLWPFALWLYQQPQVDTSCLALQDNIGADVNLLLYCVWHGVTRGPIETTQWHPLLTCSQYWQAQILQPLRTARRNLKSEAEALYELAKKAELACEQAELEALEQLTDKTPSTSKQHFSAYNLSAYLNLLQQPSPSSSTEQEEITKLWQHLLSPLHKLS